MLTPEYKEHIPDRIAFLMNETEGWALSRIAEFIAENAALGASSEYMLRRLHDVQRFEEDYSKKLAVLTKKTEQEIDSIFEDAAKLSHSWDKEHFGLKNIPFVPYDENGYLQQLVGTASGQLKKEIGTLTNSRALLLVNPFGQYAPLPESFAAHMDTAAMEVAAGVASYDDAIKRTVKTIAESGIRTVRYETPGKQPVNRRIEGVIRANVLTSVSAMATEITAHNMNILDVDYVETTAHTGSRPEHELWQGRWFYYPKAMRDRVAEQHWEVPAGVSDGRYPDLIAGTQYTYPGGLMGVNCRHDFYPVFLGIDEPTYTDDELRELAKKNAQTKEYTFVSKNGKEAVKTFTQYEASQRQRAMERTMRATRREAHLMKSAAMTARYHELKSRYRGQRSEYKDFSDAMGLRTEFERVTMDGFGKL